jgi:putative flippase GtrA
MSDTIIASIISGIVSLVVGFFSGYKYCFKTKIVNNQSQKALDNATQIQVGGINEKK